jgi:glycosidase
MMNVFKLWLDRGADGFRVDAINHMYETEGLPNEAYVNPGGDRKLYDNLIHTETMNRVSRDKTSKFGSF